MLIKCKECELQVSDKAISCPHCGYPLNTPAKRTRSTAKRRKLPNGFGQITKLNKPGLRKPYRAMITVGFDSNGKCKQVLLKPVSYFETYNDAYEALLEYRRNPYDIESSSCTLADLYEKWSDEYFKKLTNPSSIRTVKSSWSRCAPIAKMQVRDIRTRHIKGVIEDSDSSNNMKRRMKSTLNLMLDYAVEYELVDKNYARLYNVEVDTSETTEHQTYSDEDMQKIIDSRECVVKHMILLQILSGWRPQELCLIKLEDINLTEMYITGGMKTEAGKNRIVPIHSAIQKQLLDWYKDSESKGSKYLFCKDTGEPLTYDMFRHRYVAYLKENNLDLSHRPHDGRKHFVTSAKRYGVNEWVIKRLVGHSIQDITEKVYTERTLDDMRKEIEKIRAQF